MKALTTIKRLHEERARIISEMEKMLGKAEEEKRALFNEEEDKRYADLIIQLEGVKQQIERAQNLEEEQKQAKAVSKSGTTAQTQSQNDTQAEQEERAFEQYLRSASSGELRADPTFMGVSTNNNGNVIPTTIVNRIIREFEDICPIYANATKFHFTGEVEFPVVDESNDTIKMGYVEEFEELTSHVFGLGTEKLSGYLAGALAIVSISLINNASINITSVVITQFAIEMKRFYERELLHGTEDKMTGAFSTKNKHTTDVSTEITIDDIVKLMGKVKGKLQSKAEFYMNEDTLTYLRLLKDNMGRPLIQPDVRLGFGEVLFGKHVNTSDAIAPIGAGKDVILFGDASGLYVNIRENSTVTVLREKYLTRHAIGFCMWAEADSKIVEKQKLAKLTMKEAVQPEGTAA